jgi:MFS family permease
VLDKCPPEHLTETSVFYSVVQEWSLYCDRKYIPHFIVSVQNFGSLLGAQIGGYTADRYGRKVVLIFSYAAMLVMCFVTTVLDSWVLFAVARCVFQLLLKMASIALFVWIVELTDAKYNLLMNLSCMWQFW